MHAETGDWLNEVCANCGLTKGSHCAGIANMNACPAHEGEMDWADNPAHTTFVHTGEYAEPVPGKPAEGVPHRDC